MFCKRCRQKTRKTEEYLSIIFSTIQLIESYFLKKIPMQCRQQTRKTETKIICFFFTFKIIEKYLGVVVIDFADSFTVECLDPLALSN